MDQTTMNKKRDEWRKLHHWIRMERPINLIIGGHMNVTLAQWEKKGGVTT